MIVMSHCRVYAAEEGGSGKIVLLEKGAYDGMAACLMYVG